MTDENPEVLAKNLIKLSENEFGIIPDSFSI